MIRYKLSLKHPQSHYIDVELYIDAITTPTVELQLPAWRPGRYELGNFAKNIKKVEVFSEHDGALHYSKINKDLWLIETNGSKRIKVSYSYFTSEINAGSCYADSAQLYVNPVHLCMYVPQRMDEQHVVELDIPDAYNIATSLQTKGKTLTAENFDELADSPFIASASLQSDFYEMNNIKFWLHFNGECKPDFNQLKSDFIKFTQTQFNFWGDFPVKEYHFLFQIVPFKFYHGVEHQKSTVIAIGPGYSINKGKVYEDILGVSSHELFHTWNIKKIRPAEMLPYDFTKENYARTGYVYEGFTTYYGDVMLLTSGVFSNEQYFETLEDRLVKHFHNYGRFNLSVAHSSWETWLDGYVPGAPYRKTSIYDEGNLIAFMLDVKIMQHTQNKKGLRDVCRVLYHEFGKKNRGYTEQDIIDICKSTAGADLSGFFNKYVYGTDDFTTPLQESFDYLGIEMQRHPSSHVCESLYGFKTVDFGNNRKVSLIAPDSPAWNAGLSVGDEILAVNNYTLKNDFNDWINYFKAEKIQLTVSSASELKNMFLTINSTKSSFFDHFKLSINNSKSGCFEEWISLNK
ncbi:MAG: PDZ domain-containing protein [Bacteroidota bacterium]